MDEQPVINIDIRGNAGNFPLDISFKSPGGVTALFGKSGSGKTSTLAMIAGLNSPNSGVIRIGEDVFFDSNRNINKPPGDRSCGYVFQNSSLFEHLSVRRNITFANWAGRRTSRFEFSDIVEMLAIGNILDRFPAGLSGGEKQRVAIGRALLSSPQVLLLDEPFTALDESRKDEIFPFLESVRDQLNLPMLFVSHSSEEVMRFADYLVVLDDGKVVSAGTVEEIFSNDEFSHIGILTGTVENTADAYGLDVINVEGQQVFLSHSGAAIGNKVRLSVPPKDVILANSVPEKISAQNHLKTKVLTINEVAPGTFQVTLGLGQQVIKALITDKARSQMALREGDICYALMKTLAQIGRAHV